MSGAGRRVFVYREGRSRVWGALLALVYGSGAIALLLSISDPAGLLLVVLLGVAAWTLTSLFLSWLPIAIDPATR